MGLTQKLGTIPLAIQTDSSNNVGIGTSTPAERLEVFAPAIAGTSQQSRLRITQGGSISARANLVSGVISGENPYFAIETRQSASPFAIVERLRIDGSGNVGIGTSSPTSIGNYRSLTLDGVDGSIIDIRLNGSANGRVFTASDAAVGLESLSTTLPLVFKTQNGSGSTERIRITSGGYTKMSNDGTYFSSTGTYHEARNSVSDATLRLSNSNASPYGLSIYFTGADPNNVSNYILQGYHPNSATSLYTIWSNGTTSGRSDIRLKKNIVDATPKLDKLMQLRVVNYEWKESLNGTKEIGLIAQEVEEVFPNLVITEPVIKTREVEQEDGTIIEEKYEDGDSKSIKHSVLPFMLLKALQEANTKIEELSAKVTALENK